ncbi:kelch-like protein 28 [Hermetia illucens]|uniref:kelch-like protein 28 n=1 Tax=Hermetia illucens TaxID=343691 RepID=UPI0018CC1D73|nr:kelch-like protein 28 [Hermetia illucens]
MADEVAQTLRIVSDSYPVDFISKFAEFRSMKRFTDITLRVGNEEFIAHKAVLSAASPTFNTMLDDETKKEVDLPHEITPKVMIAILDYMYSGRLQIKMEYFPLLFRNANYLGMENLKNEIPKALLARLNPGNCISTLFLATETGLRDVFLKAREVLAKQFRLISKREIQKLNRAQLECVLSMIQQSGGYFKFLVIIHWIKYDEVNRPQYMYNLTSKYIKTA